MRRISAFLVVMILLLTVFAYGEESNTLCSVTFVMEHDGTQLTGGSLSMYLVGTAQGDRYVPVQELAGENVNLDVLDDVQTAISLEEAVKRIKLEGLRAYVQDGKAAFTGLAPGLYLVIQEEGCEGYSPIRPFLITLPRMNEGEAVYDLTAKPKVSPEPLPTETTEPAYSEPTLPPDEDLPQTGQLRWPIPVLTAGGIAMILIGCFLCCGKKEQHEA